MSTKGRRDCGSDGFAPREAHSGPKPSWWAVARRTAALVGHGRTYRRSAIGLVALALAAGCSSTEDVINKYSQPASSPSFTERFRNLFGVGSDNTAAADSKATESASSGSTKVACPPTDIRKGAGTLQMTAPGSDQAMGVRYQATFSRTARQCSVEAGNLSIKVGVQGRVILGPAGTAGDTTVPLRYALVQEGIEPKTIWTKLYLVPVAIPQDQPNVPFTHVIEDLTVPMPSTEDLSRYVIYVGFDPRGIAEEKQKKPRRGQKPTSG